MLALDTSKRVCYTHPLKDRSHTSSRSHASSRNYKYSLLRSIKWEWTLLCFSIISRKAKTSVREMTLSTNNHDWYQLHWELPRKSMFHWWRGSWSAGTAESILSSWPWSYRGLDNGEIQSQDTWHTHVHTYIHALLLLSPSINNKLDGWVMESCLCTTSSSWSWEASYLNLETATRIGFTSSKDNWDDVWRL